MCTGRVDLAFLHRAFSRGIDGVVIAGCLLGECHYITEGNYGTLSMTLLFRKLLEHIGVNPERLRLEWISASEGMRFAEVMNDFSKKLKALGPLGKGEGLDKKDLTLKLEAVKNLIPYIKLVERERLRVRFDTGEEYEEFFSRAEVDKLCQELMVDKLAMSQLMAFLMVKPIISGEKHEIRG